MTQREKDIEQKLRKAVEAAGGKCVKWTCPGWTGVPDRLVLLPGGRIVFVELKRPKGGKLSEMQKWWQRELDRLGFETHIIWNDTDLWALKFLYL